MSVSEKNRQRLTSITSVRSGMSSDDGEKEAEEIDEDLPEVPFARIFGMNKPEICYIIRKSVVDVIGNNYTNDEFFSTPS